MVPPGRAGGAQEGFTSGKGVETSRVGRVFDPLHGVTGATGAAKRTEGWRWSWQSSARPYVPCSPAGAAARSRREGRGEARRAWQQPQHRTKKQAAGKGAGDQSQPGSGDPPTSSRASSHCSMGEEPARRQTRSSSALSGCTHLNFCLSPWAGSELHSCSDHWEALPCCISFRLKLLLFGTCRSAVTAGCWRPPCRFGEGGSLPGERRENPQGYTPGTCLGPQPSAGKGCSAPCDSLDHRGWKETSRSSTAVCKALSLGQGQQEEEAQIFLADSPDAV